ncbi:hypothetical protein CMUS01_09539 [Colletotrichum musicola]|uniref:Uncharacterized protein n=1 Tax=Colletotrichum musicola TaxID=2175873 RepID=A0A8H6NB06_9PEZI|nr:hypothetical protein CMUS01_09539 [Colletotrichum musicola]
MSIAHRKNLSDVGWRPNVMSQPQDLLRGSRLPKIGFRPPAALCGSWLSSKCGVQKPGIGAIGDTAAGLDNVIVVGCTEIAADCRLRRGWAFRLFPRQTSRPYSSSLAYLIVRRVDNNDSKPLYAERAAGVLFTEQLRSSLTFTYFLTSCSRAPEKRSQSHPTTMIPSRPRPRRNEAVSASVERPPFPSPGFDATFISVSNHELAYAMSCFSNLARKFDQ